MEKIQGSETIGKLMIAAGVAAFFWEFLSSNGHGMLCFGAGLVVAEGLRLANPN